MSRLTVAISANGYKVARQGDGFRKGSTHPTATAVLWPATVIPSLRGAKRRSNPFFLFCGKMDCFTSLAITDDGAGLHLIGLALLADLGCPVRFAKIFWFTVWPNHLHVHRRLAPLEGRIAIVTDAGRDAMDAAAPGRVTDIAGRAAKARERSTARRRMALACGRRSRVVLTPRCRRQVSRRRSRPDRARTSPIRETTVTRKPDHRGEHEGNR
ncbi:MAG: hypothetical protein JWP25_7204 [Bradyrhizobium sp.]|jgi:hypothetical protein|nr:hypothetical protein [Bradyrhizobium sp.]